MIEQTEENTGLDAPDDSDWYTADELIAMRRKKKFDRQCDPRATVHDMMVAMMMRQWREEREWTQMYLDELLADWYRRRPLHEEKCNCVICKMFRRFPPGSIRPGVQFGIDC